MASTNKTSHYNLSQYVANDKPTYLVDYNSDMSNIDAGIYSADSKATINAGAIGDLSTLDTTNKTDLVSAVNEVNTQAQTNKNDITSLNTDVSANTGNIGTMANLDTTDKTSLVNAINEVKTETDNNTTNINKFNLTNITTYNTGDLNLSDVTINSGNVTVATNSDYSIMKIYGKFSISTPTTWASTITIPNAIPSGYRPTSDITVSPAGVPIPSEYNSSLYITASILYYKIKTDGSIEIQFNKGTNIAMSYALVLIPFVIFVKDFGDVAPTI